MENVKHRRIHIIYTKWKPDENSIDGLLKNSTILLLHIILSLLRIYRWTNIGWIWNVVVCSLFGSHFVSFYLLLKLEIPVRMQWDQETQDLETVVLIALVCCVFFFFDMFHVAMHMMGRYHDHLMIVWCTKIFKEIIWAVMMNIFITWSHKAGNK